MASHKPLYQLLNIKKGLTAVIGGGGKSALLHTLAWELPGTVILTTSTYLYPFPGISTFSIREASVKQAFTMLQLMVINNSVVCVGAPVGNGKLTTPIVSFRDMKLMADYVLVEADTAKGLPIKAHEKGEPKLPKETDRVIHVVGASGFDRPVREVCDHPDAFALVTGANANTHSVRPDLAAKAIRNEGWTKHVFLNQIETKASYENAAAFKAAWPEADVIAGSLKLGIYTQM